MATIFEENFNDSSINQKGAVGPGNAVDISGVTKWSIDISGASLTAISDWFRVENGVFEGRDLDGTAIWTSQLVDISGFNNVSFNLDAIEDGDHEDADFFDVSYSIDGGISFTKILNADGLGDPNHTLVGDLPDDNDWESTTITQTIPDTADNLIIQVEMSNNAGSERLRLDNVIISGNSGGGDTTPPLISTLNPTDDTTNVTVDTNLEVTFNESVQAGTGNIIVKQSSDDSVVETIDINSASINGSTVTIDPTNDLVAETDYYVEIENSAIEDISGNTFAGISDNSTWNFTTQSSGNVIEILINEIYADPATDISGDANGDGTRDSTEDEFVEIVNNGNIAVDISDWTISDGFGVRHTFAAGTVVPPQGAVVVFGGGTPTETFGSAIVTTANSGALGLNNSGDTVTLTDDTSTIQATATYGSEGGNNESLTLDPDLDTTDGFVRHSTVADANGALFSPGTRTNGVPFEGAQNDLVINELRISSSGASDDTSNFVELFGAPQTALSGLTLLAISGEFAPGQIDFAIPLDGASTDSEGVVLIANSFTTVSTEASDKLVSGLDFFGSPVTFALVKNFTGTQGNDLDTDDDGTLETTPWSNLITSVSLEDSDGTSDQSYSPTVVNSGDSFAPAGLVRDPDGTGSFLTLDFADLTQDTPSELNSSGSGGSSATVATIPQIQGSGAVSPLENQVVTTTGVVVGDFQGSDELSGFFIQDAAGDGDITTSDGIFVYVPQANSTWFGFDVLEGQTVEVTGEVNEFNGFTELSFISDITITDATQNPLTPTTVTLPETTDGELEQYEGMLVEIGTPMTVSQNFFLGRYGQMTLASPDDEGNAGRLYQPTNLFRPNTPEAAALASENARRLLVLDDGQDVSDLGDNPDPVPYLGAPPPDVIRAGDTVTNLVGVLDFGRINSSQSDPVRDYRLQPTQEPVFTQTNPRPANPDSVGGSLTVGSFNVLNYFNGDGTGGGFPTSRGADTLSEFNRQRDKIISAIATLDPDVLGLMEIENDGYGANSAIQDLVNGLNAELGAGTYDFVDPGTSSFGSDEIAVGFIYKPGVVQIASGTIVAALDTGEFTQEANQRHRQPMAVTFEEISSGEEFTAVVNHFKSKGSLTGIAGDEDQGDGQGNNNLSRTNAANELATWLQTNPTRTTDSDYIVLGDLNAYAEEDPIIALENSGYTNLIEQNVGSEAYSFTFDGQAGYLDHALTSSQLTSQVTGATEWHINTDEPAVINYDEDFNPAGYYSPDSYRASDHDPVIIGLNLRPTNTAPLFSLSLDLPFDVNFTDTDDWTYGTSEMTLLPSLSAVNQVSLDTTADSALQAGFFRADQILDRNAGYSLSFTAKILAESREASAEKNGDGLDDRAGFSAIAIGDDLQGLEIGFFSDRIWVQEDGTSPSDPEFFTQAESVSFDTTQEATYTLTVLDNKYSLFAQEIGADETTAILHGVLRDYSASGATVTLNGQTVMPYAIPNFTFFGDDTTSAQASFNLSNISLSNGVETITLPDLPENSSNGTVVGTVTATDAEGDMLTFSITGNVDPDGDGNNAFDINSNTGEIIVTDSDDLDFETNSSFNLDVEVSDGNLSDTATVTINLEDRALVSIEDTTVTETDTNQTLSFTMTVDDPLSEAFSLSYQTDDRSAHDNGFDYVAKNGSVSFSAGQTSQTIDVTILGDTVPEATEQFALRLNRPGNSKVILTDREGLATIEDNDPIATLSVSDPSVVESDSGTYLSFIVRLSAPSGQPVSVDYSTANDTAIAGDDYTATSGTLNFVPGNTSRSVNIPIAGDTTDEGDEQLFLNLSNASGASISDAQGVGTILDDDDGSAITVTGTANGDFLVGGDADESFIGLGGNDFLIGLGGSNTFQGDGGSDYLLGFGGQDTFVFPNLTDSVVSDPDIVANFNTADGDQFNVGSLPNNLFSAGMVSGTDLSEATTNAYTDAGVVADDAVFFSWGNKDYLSVNDGTVGFSESDDLVAQFGSLVGGLPAEGSLTVGDYFTA